MPPHRYWINFRFSVLSIHFHFHPCDHILFYLRGENWWNSGWFTLTFKQWLSYFLITFKNMDHMFQVWAMSHMNRIFQNTDITSKKWKDVASYQISQNCMLTDFIHCKFDMFCIKVHFKLFTVQPRLSSHVGSSTYVDTRFYQIWELC